MREHIYTWHNPTLRRWWRLSKRISLEHRFIWGQNRNLCKWDLEGTAADCPQGWGRTPPSTDADGYIESRRYSCSGTGNPWGPGCWHRLAATHGQEAGSGWMHQAPRLCVVKPPCGRSADVPHLVPVFLPIIYVVDTWQPEEVHLWICTVWALSDP